MIGHERTARERLITESRLRITDRVMRSYGILSHAAIVDTKEAAQRLSDVRLGVDLGLLDGLSIPVMNELNVMTQPGFLQKTFGDIRTDERDIYRAQLIRDTINAAKSSG